MDEIRSHHFETVGNHHLLVCRGIIIPVYFVLFKGGAGFCLSTVCLVLNDKFGLVWQIHGRARTKPETGWITEPGRPLVPTRGFSQNGMRALCWLQKGHRQEPGKPFWDPCLMSLWSSHLIGKDTVT